MSEDYQRLWLAVQDFQNGNSEAANIVLDGFKDYIEGFVMLLGGQAVKNLTYSHRLFLSAFIKVPGLARSIRSKRPIQAAYLAAEAALTTVSIQLRPVTREDLRQEALEIFLGTLRRYKSRNEENYLIPYIQKCFPYALARRVRQLVKDPLVNLASDKIVTLDDIQPPGLSAASFGRKAGGYKKLSNPFQVDKALIVTYEQASYSIGDDPLDKRWLEGDECHEVFDQLTYIERKIVKQFYYLQMTDAQIAKQLGVSYNTAVRRRYHIESKLRGEYTPPTCRWCDVEIPKTILGRQPRQCEECRRIRKLESQRQSREARKKQQIS